MLTHPALRVSVFISNEEIIVSCFNASKTMYIICSLRSWWSVCFFAYSFSYSNNRVHVIIIINFAHYFIYIAFVLIREHPFFLLPRVVVVYSIPQSVADLYTYYIMFTVEPHNIFSVPNPHSPTNINYPLIVAEKYEPRWIVYLNGKIIIQISGATCYDRYSLCKV